MSKITRFVSSSAFAIILLFGVGIMSAHAQATTGLTSSQISAVISLLQSFGVDQSIINNVEVALNGGTTTGTNSCYNFSTNLRIGMSGPDVTALQTALQNDGETVTVNGSFDEQTASAVTGFQQKYASDILTPNGLQYGTGYVGFSTRAKLNALCGSQNNQPPATQNSIVITSINPASAPVGSTVYVSSSFIVGGNEYSEVCFDNTNVPPSSCSGITSPMNFNALDLSSTHSFNVPSGLSSGSHTIQVCSLAGEGAGTNTYLCSNNLTINIIGSAIPPVPELTVSESSSFGNQTIAAGTSNVRLGSFTLSAGPTEGVTITQISLTIPNATQVGNLSLRDDATGAQLGSVIISPLSGGAFPLTLDIPASSTKTVNIYGNINPSASGSIQATVSPSVTSTASPTLGRGDITGISASINSATLQTITISSSTQSTAPTITVVSPGSAKLGDMVYVYGSNFDRNSYIAVDVTGGLGIAPLNSSFTSTSMSFYVPPGMSVGSHTIWVAENGSTIVSNSVPFTVVASQ